MKKYVVIAANFFAPGLGSLWAGKTASGALQLLIALLAALFWMTIGFRLLMIPLLLFAWIWGMITALRYKQRAELDESTPISAVLRRSNSKLSMRRPERS